MRRNVLNPRLARPSLPRNRHLRRTHTREAAAAWYRAKYSELSYSHLLNQLAAMPAERQQLLRQYFEPTPEEAEQHLKVPTLAHLAVAELVKGGYVRVILQLRSTL